MDVMEVRPALELERQFDQYEHNGQPDDLDALKARVRELEDDKQRLQSEMEVVAPTPVGGQYTLSQFLLRLAVTRRRTYAWRADYARATQQTPNAQKVSIDDIQKWQKADRVPEWAFAQVTWLQFNPQRNGHAHPPWSTQDKEFLISLYEADPYQSNIVLADKCTVQFGRAINVPAIKGELFRLGRAGKVPERRPPRNSPPG